MNNNEDSNNILSLMIRNHLDPNILEELEKALLNTFHASCQEDINNASRIITHHQSQPGYLIYIIEIINNNLSLIHHQINEKLVSCALAQLKAYIRQSWKKMVNDKHNDCGLMVNSLVRTSFNLSCVDNPRIQVKYMKLLKDVVEMTCSESIAVYPEIVAIIEANRCSPQIINLLPACLNIFLGLINNISLLLKEYFFENCIQMVEKLDPLLYEFMQWGQKQVHALYEQLMAQQGCQNSPSLQRYLQFKRKYEEILYLNIKFFYKALFIKSLDKIRHIFLKWIPVAMSRVDYVDAAFTSYQQQQEEPDTGLRGTDSFNYYHGKKWAIKLVRRAMEKVLVYNNRCSPAGIAVIKFYQLHLHELTQLFRNAWQYQWPQRIKFQLLKTLDRFIACQPVRLVKEYEDDLKYYQETLLPPMIDLSTEKDIIEESPAEFLYRQEMAEHGGFQKFQSCRLTATRVWLSIANIDFLYDRSCQDSKMLMKSLMQLNSYLQTVDQDTLQLRDIACFLLVNLRKRVMKMDQLQEGLRLLVNRTIRENLQICDNSYFMVLVRALDLAIAYQQLLEEDLIANIRSRILTIFRQLDLGRPIRFDAMIVLQRGSETLCNIVTMESRRGIQISTEDAKMVVVRLFELVRLTSNEEFIVVVNKFLMVCMNCLGDCYKDIARFLQGWFVRYMQLDMEYFKTAPAHEYRQNYMEIARGTISIYETILSHMSQEDDEIVDVLDSEVYKIVTCIFLSEGQFEDSFLENGVNLLCVYLRFRSRMKSIGPKIIRLCKFIIIRLAGLSAHTIDELKQARVSQEKQKWVKLYLSCKDYMIYGFQVFVPIVRLFIKHIPFGEEIRSISEISRSILHKQTKHSEYLIFLASRFFGSCDPTRYSETCNGKCFSLLTLVHYYEHHQRADCNKRVHSSFNQFTFNLMLQVHREYPIKGSFAKYNVQLFCLWIHEVQEGFVQYTTDLSLSQLSQFFSSVLIFNKYFGLEQLYHYEQNNRCTFGLSTFIRLGLKFNDLWGLLEIKLWIKLVSFAIRFGYKSTETFINNSTDELIVSSEDQTKPECKENKQINYNAQVLAQLNSQQIGIGNAPKKIAAESEGEWEDEEEGEVRSEQQGLGSDEEADSLDDFGDDNENEDCWDYEQTENCMDPSPLESHDDGKYLLDTLYGLFQANQALYRSIILTKRLGDKITAILHSTECSKNPQLRHLCYLSPDSW